VLSPSMSTFTAQSVVAAPPAAVLTALVDTDALARWSPVPFRVVHSDRDRLRTGSRARIVGSLAGLRAAFDVRVQEVLPRSIRLSATGPVRFDVAYRLRPARAGTAVAAEITVARGDGVVSRLMTSATEALLGGGVMHTALARLDREARRHGGGCPEAAGEAGGSLAHQRRQGPDRWALALDGRRI
jgi:uncharacterized protein YndB with AHSA1/START domain